MIVRSRLMLCSALSAAAAALAVAVVINSQTATAARASSAAGAKATGGGHILMSPGSPGVHFGFNAQVQNNGRLQGSGVVQDQAAGVRIKILTVETYASDGVSAAFTGQCEFDGVEQPYEIDVSDIDEPGTGVDLFEIATGTYARSGILTGGNIQVRGVAVANPSPTPTPTPDLAPRPDKRGRQKSKRDGL